VKGVKKIGVRLGNWLLPEQVMALLEAPDPETMKGKRDVALLAILVACGLRRHEAVELNVSDLQQREWEDLQEGDTCRHFMGKRAERKGRLAPGQALCEKSQHRETRSTRSPPNLRPALPSGRRRTGSDSVSAWTCIGTDNRAIPWLQAADPQRCQ
jgi:integrase